MFQTDTYRHKGMRNKLVEIVERKGITNKKVLEAIGKVPRHLFFDPAFLDHAYEDKAFQIGEGQTISQPFTVAYMTEWLETQPGMKVLEVGTGSGYQACVLSEMGVKVFSIERFRALQEKAKKMLHKLGYINIKTFFGDGYAGLPAYAPFDRIIITAAATEIPQLLLKQLKIGGIMILPLGNDENQTMIRMTKTSNNDFKKEAGEGFRFVPMLPGKVH
ncbi:MAG: protein-L-isoaspartate(D-aspartate) O-methyltransferase [Fimbriimonadaceae bacterium]|nr:protein-L-isoaspartate(D-aspartate) O-methyltransferase [Chitinophagales bacterium]